MGKIVRLNEHVLRLIETLTNSNQLYIIENDTKSLFRAIVVRRVGSVATAVSFRNQMLWVQS